MINSEILTLRRPNGWIGKASISWSNASLQALLNREEEFLSEGEKLLCGTSVVAARRRTFLIGRYCAKEALCLLTGMLSCKCFSISRGVFHQPVVRAVAGLDANVSIAHTEKLGAALAFDRCHPMGLDIELVDPQGVGIIFDQLTATEKELGSRQTEVYFIIWTMKEALAKALLIGLMAPMAILEISDIEREDNFWHGTFTNFPQYHSYAFAFREHFFAIALPRNTNLYIPARLATGSCLPQLH
jgi:4'-phosphopantetheinyl transferase EntD